MKIGLFIPCYIDQFYPGVAIATLKLLEKLQCTVFYPEQQTCCGQPLANAGFAEYANGCSLNFIQNFNSFDFIVSPSGSCVLHIKEHLSSPYQPEEAYNIKSKIYELSEFLIDILKIDQLNTAFPHRVGLHIGCHGQRGLNICSMSETIQPFFSKTESLLKNVKGIELLKTQRWDECCGFGGTFSVTEDAVSTKMGLDRLVEYEALDVDYIVSNDMSCLMHLEGLINRIKSKIKVIHLAEILIDNEKKV
jgi:L-lactate dehydrogenase complex protein LldE